MKMTILINGYGVPENIFTDYSYHSYLGQVLNYLWDNHRMKQVRIIACGGHTDMRKPYRRTEGEEMIKWLAPRIKKLGLEKQWRLRTITTGLNALDNLLAARRIIGNDPITYVCERTREKKSRVLLRKVFGARSKVLAIDFDTSEPRYDRATRTEMEQEDLRHCLKALKDPAFAKKLRMANRMKIDVLRKFPAKVRAREIDKIILKLREDLLA